MSATPQVGSGVVVQAAPLFDDYVVVAGTWKMKDALQLTPTRDGVSNMVNYTGWSPGQECECEWMIKAGNTPAAVGQVIPEVGGAARSFVVMPDLETSNYGGKPLRQKLKLMCHQDGFNPVVVT